ncbi:hypothetical protein [Actinomadura atramentaria]|uniref:hypothetical protein n=1 Tax=Actinomadura atramentaria TaxID=1990 RepID=UPI0003A89AA2|nr:hypothetical protein [Actinomadura atramentaria]
MGNHERKINNNPVRPSSEPFKGFYRATPKTSPEELNPALLHRERFAFLSRLHEALGSFPNITSGITHVNTYPVLHVFRVGTIAHSRRVVVIYRDGDWWFSWNDGGVPAAHTAEAAHQIATTVLAQGDIDPTP